jgi:hypothetical protein
MIKEISAVVDYVSPRVGKLSNITQNLGAMKTNIDKFNYLESQNNYLVLPKQLKSK